MSASVWSDFGIFSSLLFVGIAVNFKEEEKKCAQPVCDSIEWHGSKMSSAHDKHWNKRKGDTDRERRAEGTISGPMMHFQQFIGVCTICRVQS